MSHHSSGAAEEMTAPSYIEAFTTVLDSHAPLHGWSHTSDEMWHYVTPPGAALRPQGWKIHLSATPRSAVEVLSAAARVLLEHRVTFKFAKGLKQLRLLLSIRMDRGAGGKFLTVYPDSDDQFSTLLESLHRATEGLEGPAILSDRRYTADSLVHYRYGGFTGGQRLLAMDGAYTPMLVGPGGEWTPDERNAWFSPPAWASVPEGAEAPETRQGGSGEGGSGKGGARGQVLLNGRFLVHEAIRHSNRGGVYRALDKADSDRRVVIKEARPFVGAEQDGSDARDYLRNEYETLSVLEPLGIAVRPVDLFSYQGHLFLAEEEVSGSTLRAWVEERVTEQPTRVPPAEAVLPVARRMLDLVTAVHDKGLVFRDFTPNNIMITSDEELVLIDTEFVAAPGQTVTRVQTPSYGAPEEMEGAVRYPAPSPAADLYNVGASLFYLCTGVHPVVPSDEALSDMASRPDTRRGARDQAQGLPTRPYDERVGHLIGALAVDNPLLASLADVVAALMAGSPGDRPELGWVRERISTLSPQTPHEPGYAPPELVRSHTTPGALGRERILADGWAQLAAAMTPDSPRGLWPAPPMEGREFDTLAVQAGGAGTLEVLRRGLTARERKRGETTESGPSREVLETALRWFDRHADAERRQLPGLYFGRSGTCWAQYETARTLGDDERARRACERAKLLPVAWGNPDITHGVAGNGLAQLHLWRRTGDEEFLARAGLCADSVLARRSSKEPVWPVPADMGLGAGLVHYGFAHGVAGVATFLLTAAGPLERPPLLELAVDAGDLLLGRERERGEGSVWPTAQNPSEGTGAFNGVCWWCSGAPGIGLFLIRLWRVTGEERFRRSAHRAAVATREERWLLGPSHCHGLAGNGEFLLDMAAATGDTRYRDWAGEHADALYRLCALHEGRLVVPDETNTTMTYSYNLGMAGPLGFLHRLRHGGERWWMVDDFTLDAETEDGQGDA